MPEENKAAVAELQLKATVGEGANEPVANAFIQVLDKLPFDSSIFQLFALTGVMIWLVLLLTLISGKLLKPHHDDRLREREDAIAREEILNNEVEELTSAKDAQQETIITLNKNNAELSAQLAAKELQTAKCEKMVESLKARLSQMSKPAVDEAARVEIARLEQQVIWWKKLADLPSKGQDHIDL